MYETMLRKLKKLFMHICIVICIHICAYMYIYKTIKVKNLTMNLGVETLEEFEWRITMVM